MANKIEPTASCRLKLIDNINNTMFLYPTDVSEIKSIVRDFLINKSSGYDDVSPRVLKPVIDKICVLLCAICNKFFQSDSFQTKLKTAKVVPIYKWADTLSVNNYRPISIYQCFLKF